MPNYRHAMVGAGSASATIFLENEYMCIGIGPAGCFGTTVAAPADFHVVNSDRTVGLVINAGGFTNGGGVAKDFLLAGGPEETVVIGINGATSYKNAARATPVITPTRFTNDSTPEILSVAWDGNIAGVFELSLRYTIKPLDKYMQVVVTYKNTSASPQSNVRYNRSFDTDVDGTGTNVSSIISKQNPVDGEVFAMARGNVSGFTASFYSYDPRAKVGVGDSYRLNTAYDPRLTDRPSGFSVDADRYTSITFEEPLVQPGQSATFTYYMSLAPDYNSAINEIRSGFTVTPGNAQTVVPKQASDVVITVPVTAASMSGNRDTSITVNYATVDSTAVAGTDYVATSGTLTFPPGTNILEIPITVKASALISGTKLFNLVLSNVVGASLASSTTPITLKYSSVQPPTITQTSDGEVLFYKNYAMRMTFKPLANTPHSAKVMFGAAQVATISTTGLTEQAVTATAVSLAKGSNRFSLVYAQPSFPVQDFTVSRYALTTPIGIGDSARLKALYRLELSGFPGSLAKFINKVRPFDATLPKFKAALFVSAAASYFA